MNYNNLRRRFPAVLKTLDDKIVEYGAASVIVEEQSIEFKSQFVPLFKMGTPLKIVYIEKDIEIQVFIGEVYLSSQQFLKLISLKDEVLPGASFAITHTVNMQGKAVGMVLPPEEKTKYFSFKPKPHVVPIKQTFPISIHSISMSQIKFTCNVNLITENLIELDVLAPLRLKKITAQVETQVMGAGTTYSYHCKILDLSGESYLTLEKFLFQTYLRERKLFPPLTISSDELNL